jgi:cell division transport system permease protein
MKAGWWATMADDLGLRRALSGWALPMLIAATIFLAALALAGAVAAARLAATWEDGAGAALTVQITDPDQPAGASTRAAAALAAISAIPGIEHAARLPDQTVTDLLRPWLGGDPAGLKLHLPAVFDLRLEAGADAGAVSTRLSRALPGALVEQNADFLRPLRRLIGGLRACALAALIIVAVIVTGMIAMATGAGLAARREAIDILHGLGATDGMIAGRFAARIALRALAGGLLGSLLSLPVLLDLAWMAAPLAETGAAPRGVGADDLPPPVWLALGLLPLAASLIGWCTAQATVRLWLVRLP